MALVLLIALMAGRSVAKADNCEFERSYNFMAYDNGDGSIHVKVLLWAYGYWYNHWAAEGTAIVYRTGDNTEAVNDANYSNNVVLRYQGDNSRNKDSYRGAAYIEAPATGDILLTKKSGEAEKYLVPKSSQAWYELNESNKEGNKFLEFDWYPPAAHAKAKIRLMLRVEDDRVNYSPETRYYDLGTVNLNDPMAAVQLFSATFSGNTDPALAGKLAVPYYSLSQPMKYTTSLDPKTEKKCTQQSGFIYVDPADTCVDNFYVKMTLLNSSGLQRTVISEPAKLPAYHAIHNFKVRRVINRDPDMPSFHMDRRYDGYKLLTWEIQHPSEEDIMPSDEFEIQRAYKSDFSDAVTIGSVSYRKHKSPEQALQGSLDSSEPPMQYEYIDSVPEAWNNPVDPDAPIYYRIRRASSYLWGWNNPLVKTNSVAGKVYLAGYGYVSSNSRAIGNFQEDHMVRHTIYLARVENGSGGDSIYYVWPKDMKVLLRRYEQGNDRPTVIPVTQDSAKYDPLTGMYEINYTEQLMKPCTKLHYTVEIDTTGFTRYLPAYEKGSYGEVASDGLAWVDGKWRSTDFYFNNVAEVTDLKVSMGEYNDRVVLTWGLGNGSSELFTVWRYEENKSYWDAEALCQGTDFYSFVDTTATPGVKYTYRVESEVACEHLVETYAEATGWMAPFATIDGVVKYGNDVGVGGVKVTATLGVSDKSTSLTFTHNTSRNDSEWNAGTLNNTYDQGTIAFWVSPGVSDTRYYGLSRDKELHGRLLRYGPFEFAVTPEKKGSRMAMRLSVTAGGSEIGSGLMYLPTDGKQHFDLVTLTYDLKARKAHLDGTMSDITQKALPAGVSFAEGSELGIANAKDLWFYALQVWNRVLSTNELASARYADNVDSKGLVGYFPFFEKTPFSMYICGLYNTAPQPICEYLLCEGTRTNEWSQEVPCDIVREYSVLTETDGSYHISDVPLGSTLNVRVESATTAFEAKNGDKQYQFNVSATQNVVTGADFYCYDLVSLSGRVLYENTTVPVQGVHFRVNGEVQKNIYGAFQQSDSQGRFTITLPKNAPVTVQAELEGHRFLQDGYFYLDGKRTFSLEKDVEAKMYDQTKVRLIGRLAGGDVQGQKRLGFGESTNNLGDDLQMVLSLEGNDAAYLIYLPDSTEIKERSYSVPHYKQGRTEVHTERKRIVLRPEVKSGEFVVDLLPVKYRLTQATAKGYPTLFDKNTTSQVIDLSNCFDTKYQTDDTRHEVSYNATYVLTYHAPISLTAVQLSNANQELDYYGIPEMGLSDFSDKLTFIPTFTRSKDSIAYTFGYPVFNGHPNSQGESQKYRFKLSAHEDYYYNNDRDKYTADRVMMKKAKVKIMNGLDSSTATQEQTLDVYGERIVSLPVCNPNFSLTGEDALRQLTMAVEVNGDYILADPIKAYVLGSREKGTETLGRDINVVDVLRDPPGSSSYAWLEEGTTFNSSYSVAVDMAGGLKIDFSLGYSVKWWMGVGSGSYGDYSSTTKIPVSVVWKGKFNEKYAYSFNTSQRIQTSSGPGYVGQAGNVFIGRELGVMLHRTDAIAALDEENYKRMQPALHEGIMRLVTTGHDSNGKPYYLVIGEEMSMETMPENEFAYSQKYIQQNLLPDLISTRNALLATNVAESALQSEADSKGKVYYLSLYDVSSPKFGQEGTYKVIKPKKAGIYPDEVSQLNMSISSWQRAIAANEELILRTLQKGQLMGQYDVSAGTSKQYSETANVSHQSDETWDAPFANVTGANLPVQLYGSMLNVVFQQIAGKIDTGKEDHSDDNLSDDDGNEVDLSNVGVKLSIKPEAVLNMTQIPSQSQAHGKSRQVGFKIEEGNHGHVNVSVYRVNSAIVKDQAEQIPFNSETMAGEVVRDYSYYDDNDRNKAEYQSANFVYFLNGGATRCPNEEAVYTSYYNAGKYLLGRATEKIDNPTLVVHDPIATNVPADEAAVFDIVLSNESEAPGAETVMDMTYVLYVVPESNPNGAKFFLDGVPFSTGISMVVHAGDHLHKKLEVRRGTVDDYENLKLRFTTDCIFPTGQGMEANLSVHFQPTSTDLTLSTPTDNWVMNTLSPHDDKGYYLPVRIEGFDKSYHNFDHIELQYKKSNQPDESYVNLCSYYADKALYDKASGTKAMITGGVIDDIFFYGDTDPIEYHYDLRAVSFCRLGNTYVTKSSKVLSGLKDTRRPELFGAVGPENGVLGISDYISIPFSEAIAGNLLDATNNFQIQGYTNETGITASTSLQFAGQPITSEVARNLVDRDFTVDVMVKTDQQRKADMVLFSQGTSERCVRFGLSTDNRLYLEMTQNGLTQRVASERLTANGNWARLAACYSTRTGLVTFYEGTKRLALQQEASLPNLYHGEGMLRWGADMDGKNGYTGRMLEARVWQKVLSGAEIEQTFSTALNGYERSLLAYYPMNEGLDDIVADKANGASMRLNGQTWDLPTGYSLHFDGKRGVQLDPTYFTRTALSDYTLSFWFAADREQQEDLVALFAAGQGTAEEDHPEGCLFIGLKKDALVLRQNGFERQVTASLCDDSWHQLSLTVDRVHDIASLYVDGRCLTQFDAKLLGPLSSQHTYLGGCHWVDADQRRHSGHMMKGYIDEVTLWEQALSESMLKEFRNTAPSGGEMGLLYYLPFSRMQRSNNDVMEPVFSPLNSIERNEHNAPRYNARLLLDDDSVLRNLASRQSYAPVRDRGELTNIGFTWTSKDNELIIRLNPIDRLVNKQNIFVTVRDVEDLAGNTMLSPLSWTVFVDRNALKWNKKYYTADLRYGAEQDFTMEVRNISGTTMQYRVDDLPEWLSVDLPEGTVQPTDEFPLRFHIDSTLDPGTHSAIISLTDQNGLSEPLMVTVRVTVDQPEWPIQEYGTTEQMNIIAQVSITEHIGDKNREYLDTDQGDLLGAFFGEHCVGKAHITKQSNGMYAAFLTVVGTEATEDQPLTFLLWRASTGKTSILEGDEVIFHTGTIKGTPERPVQLHTGVDAMQEIALEYGWNWVSFNIKPYQDEKGDFSSAFLGGYQFTNNDVIKSEDCDVSYDIEDGWLFADGVELHHDQSYMMLIGNPGTLCVTGTELTSVEDRTLTFHQGWNYLPYLSNRIHTITQAMADYVSPKAWTGDVVKGHTEFAIMSEDGHWVGSLTHMYPGVGYMLQRKSGETVTFTYPLILGTMEDPQKANVRRVPGETAAPTLRLKHAHNMPILARAIGKDGMESQKGDILRAYQGKELVGECKADDEGRFFLMTSADEGSTLRFTLTREGDMTDDGQPLSSTTVRYDSQAVLGTTGMPLLISFEDEDGRQAVYDLNGRRMPGTQTRRGVYIMRDKSGEYHKEVVR